MHADLTGAARPNYYSDRGVVLDKGVMDGRWRILSSKKIWDRDKSTSCLCDPGYVGNGCQEMECPRGDDPLTTEDDFGIMEVDDVQTITVGPGTSTIRHHDHDSGWFTLTYEDASGKKWTTRPISASDKTDMESVAVGASAGLVIEQGALVTAAAVRDALMNLPNDVVNKVEVSIDTSSSAGVGLLKYRVTFVGTTVRGKQKLLECNHVGCDLDGCSPRFKGIQPVPTATCTVKGTTSYYHETETVATSEQDGRDGTAEFEECSRRGMCNRKTGRCSCFDGYQGAACNIQTVLI